MNKLKIAVALAIVGLALWIAPEAQAEVTGIEISSRSDLLAGRSFGLAGPYEKLVGKGHFALDPKDPHNRIIVDLDKAPRNARGQIEFTADIYILKPKDPTRGNGAALVEVPNRGGKGMLRFFNHGRSSSDPSSEADIGDGFLMRQGYTLVWIG